MRHAQCAWKQIPPFENARHFFAFAWPPEILARSAADNFRRFFDVVFFDVEFFTSLAAAHLARVASPIRFRAAADILERLRRSPFVAGSSTSAALFVYDRTAAPSAFLIAVISVSILALACS
jgi:hypothetical protein